MYEDGLVSIVIPIYNVEKYLNKCIESCINQRHRKIEILLIDDCSTDNSREIAEKYEKKDMRVRLIKNSNNIGVSATRNEGIRKSNGEYIVFLDADDYLSDEFIQYMLMLCNETSSEMAFSTKCYVKTTENENEEDKILKVDNMEATSILLSPYVEVGCWNKIYKKDFLVKNEIFFSEDLFFGEGLDFICRASQKAKSVGVGRKKVYYYRKNNLKSATTDFKYQNMVNGEKALVKIKDDFICVDEKLQFAWNLHYTLFCINTIINLINNKNGCNNYDEEYIIWKKRIREYGNKLIKSSQTPNRYKMKVFIAMYAPKILALRSKRVKYKNIKKSV